MAKYQIVFEDKDHGITNEYFDSFDEAMDFWNAYADTPSCVAGDMSDTETGESIWSFDERAED